MAATPRRSGESPSEYRRRLEQMEQAATMARRGRLVRAAPPARQEIRSAGSTTPVIMQDYSALEERVLANLPRWRALWERVKQALSSR